jgi:hypothetical protein
MSHAPWLLDDDEDTVDLRDEVEGAFDIRLTDEEAISCRTAGDLYALVAARFEVGTGRCGTSMAFYRLRRSLRRLADDAVLTPRTELLPRARVSARRLYRELNEGGSLRLPPLELTWIGLAGAALLLSGWLPTLILADLFGLSSQVKAMLVFLAVTAGVVMIRLDPCSLREDCRTLGGLARGAAALNFGKLAHEGAAVRAGELWAAVQFVAATSAGIPARNVGRETLILPPSRRAA